MNKFVIGIDVGGTKTAYGVFDSEHKLVEKHRHESDSNLEPEEFFDIIIRNIIDIRKRLEIDDNLLGIGIGVPSFVNFDQGYIVKTSNLIKIKEFPAIDYMKNKLGDIRIVIDNDCHAAALAEHTQGAGKGFSHMLYCPVSTGISSGMIVNNELFRGTYGWSGESGHMIITPNEGVECGCGNRGCFMSWCSGSMIIKHIKNWIQSGDETIMTNLAGDEDKITAVHISKAYDFGDAMAIRAVDQMAHYMSIWLYNLYVTMNINCVVFGGGLLGMGEKLFGQVRNKFDEFNQSDRPVYFKNAELGDDCGIIGAAELIIYKKRSKHE